MLKINPLAVRLGVESKRPELVEGRMANYETVSSGRGEAIHPRSRASGYPGTFSMKFIADRTLGKLAKRLRMLGYDTLYFAGQDFHHLFHLARDEARVLLTRDTKLALMRPKDRIITVAEDTPSRQLEEVVQKTCLALNDEILFSRCLLCNEQIGEIPHQEAEGKVPDFIFLQQKDFFRCPKCQRIYWKGSHLTHMRKKVKALMDHFKDLKSII